MLLGIQNRPLIRQLEVSSKAIHAYTQRKVAWKELITWPCLPLKIEE